MLQPSALVMCAQLGLSSPRVWLVRTSGLFRILDVSVCTFDSVALQQYGSRVGWQAAHLSRATPKGEAMPSLKEHVNTNGRRQAVIDDACAVLEAEVADKSGLGGIAVKTGYKLLKSIKPGFVREVVDGLLDEFLDALDPICQQARAAGQEPAQYIRDNRSRTADALLSVTDHRAETSRRAGLKNAYEKLRPSAKRHVEAATPRLADLVSKHAPPA